VRHEIVDFIGRLKRAADALEDLLVNDYPNGGVPVRHHAKGKTTTTALRKALAGAHGQPRKRVHWTQRPELRAKLLRTRRKGAATRKKHRQPQASSAPKDE
jgi:hypothetical protein